MIHKLVYNEPIAVGSICLFTFGIVHLGMVQEVQAEPSYRNSYKIEDLNDFSYYFGSFKTLVLNSNVVNDLLSKYSRSQKEHSPTSKVFDICRRKIKHNDICIVSSGTGDFFYAFNYNDSFKQLISIRGAFKLDSKTLSKIMLLKLKYS